MEEFPNINHMPQDNRMPNEHEHLRSSYPNPHPKPDNTNNFRQFEPQKRLIDEEFSKSFFVSNVCFKKQGRVESPYAEITFKCGRKRLYRNDKKYPLNEPEMVIVEVENGMDLGTISACGPKAVELLKTCYKNENPAFSIVRHINNEDLDRYNKNREDEEAVLEKTKEIVLNYNLDMKVTDAEWQFDRQRLTIYFTAPQRIDFRELVKELARTFKTRIELRQISTREEAKRLGGIGPCGRNLCCSFCSEFCHVTLEHARTQQLSNNVAKLSGYCGRLKCCLLYEFDTYVEAFKKYPPLNYLVEFPEGVARIVKVDIFKDLVNLHIKDRGVYKQLTFDELETFVKSNKVFPPANDDFIDDELAKELEELKKLEEEF